MTALMTDFRAGLPVALRPYLTGGGQLNIDKSGLRLTIDPDPKHYSDSQITDYQAPQGRDYHWAPPMHMTVRAAFSHSADQFRGTAGFGLWNQPFMPGQAMPRLPRAAWFFMAGQSSNMALAKGIPGTGWKAATLDATRLPFLLLAPTAPLGILLMRNPVLYNRLYPIAQRALGVSEALVPGDAREVHTYEMEWHADHVIFRVDGALLLKSASAPRGKMGFIAWVDNQFAVVTPQGRLAMGLTPIVEPEWLRIETLTLE